MRNIDNNNMHITCDNCGKDLTVVMEEHFQGWVNKARDQEWSIIITSPVPFSGLDLCPDCVELLTDKLSDPVKLIADLCKKGNPTIDSTDALLKTFAELVGIIISQTENQEQSNIVDPAE